MAPGIRWTGLNEIQELVELPQAGSNPKLLSQPPVNYMNTHNL